MAARKTSKKKRTEKTRIEKPESIEQLADGIMRPVHPVKGEVKESDPIHELNEMIDFIDREMAPVKEKLRKLERSREELDDKLAQAELAQNIKRWERLNKALEENLDLLDLLAPEHRSRLCGNEPDELQIGDKLCPRCTLNNLGAFGFTPEDLANFNLKLCVEYE